MLSRCYQHPRAWSNLNRRFGMSIVARKRCSKCEIEKPLDEFPNDKRVRDGKRAECKSCKATQNKAYRESHKEQYKKTKHAYYISHREEILVKVREYSTANLAKLTIAKRINANKSPENQERYRSYHRKAFAKWRETHREWRVIWRKNNPHKGRQYNQTRRVREKGCKGGFTANEWSDLLDKYGHKCLRCGTTENITADHVVPISLGGSGFISNIQPLCRSCNSKKHNKIIDYRPFL